MQLSGAKVVVVGLGVSGVAAAQVLLRKGAQVIANDLRADLLKRPEIQALQASGATLMIGRHDAGLFQNVDLVVVSPGVPALPELATAQNAGVPVVSEVELASWFIRAPIVAVTGTNGKSTVTTLVGQMCISLARPLFVGGNLGKAAIDVVDTPAADEAGLVVLELSSFQLERLQRFRPHVAAILNVTPDHLDRYPNFDAYKQAKAHLFDRQLPEDVAIAPAADAECRAMAQASRAKVSLFGQPDGAVRIEAGMLVDDVTGLRVPIDEIGIKGAHNMSNAACSALISRHVGVDAAAIRTTLQRFRGLAHRMQFVREIGGVSYFDDSKATNVGAAVAALDGMDPMHEGLVVILGGKHKGASYAPVVERLKHRGRAVVLIGEATALLKAALQPSGLRIECAASMKDAVWTAQALARSGDAVLLAPACSSYDMFDSYVQRGEAFQEAVRALGELSSKEAC